MKLSLTTIGLIAGVLFFSGKYLAVFNEHTARGRVALTLRFLASLLAVTVLLLPHDADKNWELPYQESLISALIIVCSEIRATACHARTGVIASALAVCYALLNATHSSQSASSSFFFASSFVVICSAPVLLYL